MGSRGPKPGDVGYRPPRDPLERIMERVDRVDGCWIWTGTCNRKGYGLITVGSRLDGTNRTVSVHRLVYARMIGAIPDGLALDHLCEREACCNPAHLEPVTNRENMRRRSVGMEMCNRGHPRAPENTRRESDGRLRCLVCQRQTTNARRAARRAAGLPR